MSILCTLKNINLAFGTKVVFHQANMTISTGDRIGLLGLNGKGKSSLFKILAGEVTPDSSVPPFQFDRTTQVSDEQKKFSVFLIPQELPLDENDSVSIEHYFYRFYPILQQIQKRLNVINELLLADSSSSLINEQKELLEKFEHLRGWELIQGYQSYLKYFGHDDLSREVRHLSGGEQKKILLALGLSSNANLILWDEPTNHLDLETIKLFEEEITNSSKAFMLISHDRYLLSKITNKIFHLKDGHIEKFEGSYSDYLEFLSQEEKSRQKLLEKLKNGLRRETEWMRQGIKARGCRSKKRVEGFHDLSLKVKKLKEAAKKNVEISIQKSSKKTKKLIELRDVSFQYDGDRLFENLQLNINRGDKIGLMGANGTGKTTLVNLILGNIVPTVGNIRRPDDLLAQYFSQKREELDPEKTPFEIVGEGDDFVHLPNGSRKHVISYLESFLFSRDEVHRPLHSFSGGERNRLQMAINLKRAGDLWIFDEPTNDLDLETLRILEESLTKFDGTVIIISHDRAFLSATTNKIWLLDNGMIENFEGGYSQVESYIEASILDRLLSDDNKDDKQKEKTVEKKEVVSQCRKLTNKEKERLKVIDSVIAETEEKLEKITELVEQFDFSNMTSEKNREYEELSAKQNSQEEELLALYEEADNLRELQGKQ